MSSFAARDFPLEQSIIAAGTDLSAYPAGTLRYLAERGLTVGTNVGLKCGIPFDSHVLNDVVLATAYPASILGQLIRRGYLVGG